MSRAARALGVALGALGPLFGAGEVGCKAAASSAVDTPDAPASPQASAMPAPLANAPTTTPSATPTVVPTGPAPVPLRGDVPLGVDTLPREAVGYTFSAALRPAEVVAPIRAPELNAAGLDAARKKTELVLAIDAAPSRMRVALVGHGFLLPPETEIRARSDRYGHVVVWPGAATYHSLAPGAMRALLGERRFDVAPIMPAEVTNKDELGKRIGIRTRKVDVATRAAKATFEIGRLPDLGEGGVLLCRLLLDLMNAPPQAPVCFTDELPLRVELHWTNHGSLAFELTGILKRTDMSPLPVPPANATYEDAPFPVAGVAPMLTRQELVALRTVAPDAPGAPGGQGGQGSSLDDSLVVSNAADELRVFYIDGVPAVWAAPGARDVLHLPRGRYVVQWRTFLGDSVEQAVTQSVPSLPATGDAGVPK